MLETITTAIETIHTTHKIMAQLGDPLFIPLIMVESAIIVIASAFTLRAILNKIK